MSEAVLEIQIMRREFEHLIASLSPWVTTAEMCARYKVTPQTLKNMELRGDIPQRIKGRWSRVALMQFEAARA